jgi:hypothetical protein
MRGLVVFALVSALSVACATATPVVIVITATPVSQSAGEQPTAPATDTPDPNVVASYDDLCRSSSNMTELQVQQYVQGFVGKRVVNWVGYVFDASETSIWIANEPRGFLWSPQMQLYGVPTEVAASLNVNQRVIFTGKIREVGTFLGQICAGLAIDVTTFIPQ